MRGQQSFDIKSHFPVSLFLQQFKWKIVIPQEQKFARDVFSFFPIQFPFPVHWPQGYKQREISKAFGKTRCVCACLSVCVCVCVWGNIEMEANKIKTDLKGRSLVTFPFILKSQTCTCSGFVKFTVLGTVRPMKSCDEGIQWKHSRKNTNSLEGTKALLL